MYGGVRVFSTLTQMTHPLDERNRCILGAHLPISNGMWNALVLGKAIGASGVQLFTANQRQWNTKSVTQEVCKRFQDSMKETGVSCNMSHGSYLINLGSSKTDTLKKSKELFFKELLRCQMLNIQFLVIHPGAAVDSTPSKCLDEIIRSLLEMKEDINRGPTRLLLESTAGQGTCVGHSFEQLAYLLKHLRPEIPDLGICLDTCHMFAAGYDIRTFENFDHTFSEFDRIVGLDSLRAFHLNDSVRELGSRVDRHAKLGEGQIKWDAFKFLMTDSRTALVPKYLETPGSCDSWKEEIEKLRKLSDGENVENALIPKERNAKRKASLTIDNMFKKKKE